MNWVFTNFLVCSKFDKFKMGGSLFFFKNRYSLVIKDKGLQSLSVNQYLRHNLGYKLKIQVYRRNKVYFSSSNVSTDTAVIVKD